MTSRGHKSPSRFRAMPATSDNLQPVLALEDGFASHLEGGSPVAFSHALGEHPALALEAVARLAEDLGETSVTCEPAVKPLLAPDDAAAPERAKRAAEQIRNLAESDAWLTLLNVEQHPGYRSLIDQILDATAARYRLDSRSWRRRAGFVFASSPQSVTPAHFDIEHSLLIQLRGKRTLSFGCFADAKSREEEIHRYWNGSFGRLLTMPTPIADFALGPGDGAYIPPYYPHWLQNGDASSLSLTIVFFTSSNEKASLLQAFNERARKFGVSPRAAGSSSARDAVKIALMRGYSRGRRVVRRERSGAR
jgi:hypothetical protein